MIGWESMLSAREHQDGKVSRNLLFPEKELPPSGLIYLVPDVSRR